MDRRAPRINPGIARDDGRKRSSPARKPRRRNPHKQVPACAGKTEKHHPGAILAILSECEGFIDSLASLRNDGGWIKPLVRLGVLVVGYYGPAFAGVMKRG